MRSGAEGRDNERGWRERERIREPPTTLTTLSLLPTQAGLLASFLLASRVDAAIARGQRADLGLCVKCGGVNEGTTCREAGCPLRGGGG